MCVDDTDVIKEAFNFLYLYPVLQYAYYSSLLITWKSQQMDGSGAKSGLNLPILHVKFYWNLVVFVHLCLVCVSVIQ